jgi:hypothetical protein
MRHIKFSEIEQFRHVVRNAPKEELVFVGTVKLHGTNASVVFEKDGSMYAQSRSKIITPEDDNAGFAKFAYSNVALLEWIDLKVREVIECEELVIFGEWCGRGVQKGVGVSELEKMFVIFAMKADDNWVDPEVWRYLTDLTIYCTEGREIYSIFEFENYKMVIDMRNPEFSMAELAELTNEVERCCPVAKFFGVDGVGEGIVWNNHENNLTFKVKGQKHSVSKVKTLAAVDVEKLNNIKEFIDYAVTENRLNQARLEVTPDLDIKLMGEFIGWMFNDITKEESDVLEKNGLSAKDIGKYVSNAARDWFKQKMGDF